MEILDIVDENGEPIGTTVERTRAHREGIRHRTSHLWIGKFRDNIKDVEHMDLLLQRRSEDKDSFPGCLDKSSAGHIIAGTSYEESAIRELKEELSIEADASELIYIGKRKYNYRRNFHHSEPEFWDNEVAKVFLMFKDVEASLIKFQKEEISQVLWMSFKEIRSLVEKKKSGDNTCKICVSMEELNLIEQYVRNNYETIL